MSKEKENLNQEENKNETDQKESSKVEIEREEKKEEQNEKVEAEKGIAGEEASKMLEQIQAKNKELQDSLLRKAAEFENYKRRTEGDQMNLLKYAAEPFIKNVLAVYDDLHRSLDHIDKSSDQESVKKGLKLVYDKFTKILKEQGVERIETEGKEFDFNYHEALMQQPANDVPPHTVIKEVEPGYLYKDKVIRHAKVVVSQEIADNGDSASDKGEEQTSE